MNLSELDVTEIKGLLTQLKETLQEGIAQSEDYPEEVTELIQRIDRLGKELNDKKSQQIISDFIYVLSFVEVMSEDSDEDEEDEMDFEED